MKKIVALVLSLVMALSLATVAFAAGNTAGSTLKLYDKDNMGRGPEGEGYWTVKAVEAYDLNGHGNVKYYVMDSDKTANTNADVENGVLYYIPCAKDDADYVVYNLNGIDAWVKEYRAAAVGQYPEAYYDMVVTEQKATTDKASCTVARYTTDGYLYKGDFYTEDKDSGANAKFGNTIVKVVPANDKVIYASHVLAAPTKNAKTGWDECKCLICGAVLACTNDELVLKANSIKADDTDAYYAINAKFVAADNGNTGKYAFVAGQQFAKDYEYTWEITAGSNTDNTKTDTKPGVDSAKTFDAGIAMYVGMSLLSVAGSAVVIGKKKEF